MLEITELRTSHGKTYDAGNGQKRLEVSMCRRHYQNGNEWLDIDTSWENEEGFGHKVQKADYHLRHWGNKLRFGFAHGIYVDYKLPCPISFEGSIGTGKIDNDTRLKYTATPDSVKMDIALSGCPKQAPSYSYDVETTGCTAAADNGGVLFSASGVPVGKIPAPYMVDASGRKGSASLAFDGSVISIVPDYAFLQAATYPVVIDPTTTIQTSASADDGYVDDYPEFVDYGDFLKLGNGSGYSCDIFARFANVTVPRGATISSAKVQYCSYNSVSTTTVSTSIYFNSADNATVPTSYASYTGKTLTTNYASWTIPAWTTGTWYDSPDISSIITEIIGRAGWASGNAMMLLHKNNGSSANASRFIQSYDASGNVYGPKLVITYTTSTQYTKSLSVTAHSTATRKLQGKKVRNATSHATATRKLQGRKGLRGTAKAAGIITKARRYIKTLFATARASAAVVRATIYTKLLSASVHASGRIAKAGRKVLSVVSHVTALFVRQRVNINVQRQRPTMIAVSGKRIGWEIRNINGSVPKINAMEQEYTVSR